ncbi:MAG: hypothetical protein RBT11_05005 [Desulfobacterales bacterium]|nr:hypothetical protein [Desulfobacterales bacterium]
MRLLVAIDDTDNLESVGTGVLASMLSESLFLNGWGNGGHVTRHQMLVHPDIPYTSHNSAMCFPAEIKGGCMEAFVTFAIAFLQKESAPGSDPGLCVVNIDRLLSPDELMAFGHDAKNKVLMKADAYEIANRLRVHLSEHGGTGQGVIGALAAVGLRLTGNDGRFKGHFKIESADGIVTPAEIKRQTHVEVVQSIEGRLLKENEKIRLGKKVKAVLLSGKSTLLVNNIESEENGSVQWETCSKQQLRVY